jgi:thiosulfate/3-mercaptopyruvate sulfurtransferase
MDPSGRAGDIPTAVHQPLDGVLDDRGAFREANALRQALPEADADGRRELITYFTIGGRAATAWCILTYLLGRDHVRVCDGSWAEWGRLPDTPSADDATPPMPRSASRRRRDPSRPRSAPNSP